MDYLTLNAAETLALAQAIDCPPAFGHRSVQLSRRDSLDKPYPEGFLVVSIVDYNGEQYRLVIGETGSTSVLGS